MSKKTSNDQTKLYSRIFGDQVILHNNRWGKTIMDFPQPRRPQKPSEKKIAYIRKFQLASRYAVNILKDPEMLAAYRAKVRKGQTPYNLALRDYLKSPVVSNIDASAYHGNPGDRIRVSADDDFKLAEVTVRIVGANGMVIEQGVCEFFREPGIYDYTVTSKASELPGVTIIAKARDIPGHVAELATSL